MNEINLFRQGRGPPKGYIKLGLQDKPLIISFVRTVVYARY